MSQTVNQAPAQLSDLDLQSQLSELARNAANTPLKGRFILDTGRAAKFSAHIGPLFVDYSKHHIDHNILNSLCSLARQRGVEQQFMALRSGAKLNNTEGRTANYPSLRRWAIGDNATNEQDSSINAMYCAMESLVAAIHNGEHRSSTGKAFTDVVNIGIGGSDFGPRLVCDALANQGLGNLRAHFAANIDPSVMTEILATVPAETTLFIVASKSFGTQETRCNAQTARTWLETTLATSNIAAHFVAVTSMPEAATAFGISEHLVISVPEWVGGRYSVWSGFGLAIALCAGMDSFRALLKGGYAVDQYVAKQPLESNTPLILGLLDVWYRNAWGMSSQAVLPYEHHLKLLPTYLQQLFMESAGKSVKADGTPIQNATGGVIWGTEGTNGQHSFHQLLHQGSDVIPCDFIASLSSHNPIGEQHQALLANCFGQSLTLMQGQTAADIEQDLIANGMATDAAQELAQHKAMPGNRPSTTILMDKLDAESLGALIALYEYRLFTASFMWGINPFDQWGVELGKQISQRLMDKLSGNSDDSTSTALDSSTAQLIYRYQQAQTS
ncbi:glucose-6-phosphate isomerase [Zhongshania sp.]|uniref:glucose-6-phosphate isomerase n=1 Tax=Zhongshania sp. TaxID=1971902 RepID=UPI00356B2F4A